MGSQRGGADGTQQQIVGGSVFPGGVPPTSLNGLPVQGMGPPPAIPQAQQNNQLDNQRTLLAAMLAANQNQSGSGGGPGGAAYAAMQRQLARLSGNRNAGIPANVGTFR